MKNSKKLNPDKKSIDNKRKVSTICNDVKVKCGCMWVCVCGQLEQANV